jgi:hypothetical protein
VPGLGVGGLRGKLRDATEGAEIEITDDAERDALQAALEAASQDQRYLTGALACSSRPRADRLLG